MGARARYNAAVRHRFFSLVSLLSLVLFVATVVVWVRSYWVRYACGGTVPGAIYSGEVSGGRVGVSWRSIQAREFEFYCSSWPQPWPIGTYGRLGKLGFFFDTGTSAAGERRISVVFPIVVLVGIAAVLPGVWLVGWGRRAAGKGRCSNCDYDLTGNTSGVCPECGLRCSTSEAGGMSGE